MRYPSCPFRFVFPRQIISMKMRLALASAVLVALAACGGGDGPPTQPGYPVASVRVDAAADSVIVGQQLQLTATPLDAAGAVLRGRTVTWSSSRIDLATVSATGLLTAAAPGGVIGNTVITATSEGVAGTMLIRVLPVPIATVTMSHTAHTMDVGDTVQLTVTPRDAAGNVLTYRPPVWYTSNAAVAKVNATGFVTAMGPGQATLTAGVEGRIATTLITVRPQPVASVDIYPREVVIVAGETQGLTAEARSANRDVLTGRPVQWSSANEAVATVSAAGVVTGVSAGTTSVTATVEGKTGQVPVIIRTPGQDATNPEITSFSVAPASIDVTNGSGSFTFSWTARDYGSGVVNVYASLTYPNNPGATLGCAGTRVSGTIYEGTYTCTVLVAQNSPSRTWSIEYVSAQDVVGNRVQINTPAIAAGGWPTQVTVTGATPDETPPTLASFSFTAATANVANGPARTWATPPPSR